MSDADQERVQGLGDQIKGRVEQGLGGLTGNREQQAQGGADEAKGKLEQGHGIIHAGFSLYWAVGGRWLLATVGAGRCNCLTGRRRRADSR